MIKNKVVYMIPIFLSQTDNKEEFLSTLKSCDIIVYHTVGISSQVEEASWAVEGNCEDVNLRNCFVMLGHNSSFSLG